MSQAPQSYAVRLAAHGFIEEQTGGGCTAYVRRASDGFVEMLTIAEDPMIPTRKSDPVVIGEYPDAEAELEAEGEMTRGYTFGDVFDVHAKIMDERGLTRHRLNACGYSLGARFSPSWMEHQMFYAGNTQEILPNMTLFVHMIIMDSDAGIAMTLGQTYVTTEGAPQSLSRHSLDMLTA